MALNRSNRISLQKDFQKILKRGKRVSDEVFLLRFVSNNHNHTRVASPISLKHSKKAVKRNKLRRRIQEVMREHLGDFAPTLDIIVMSRPEAIKLEYDQIKTRLEKLISKIQL